MFLKPPPGVAHAHVPIAPTPLTPVQVAVLALAMLAPFLLYFATAESMVSIWNSSDTFAHGYVILPISLALIWRRRENFSLIPTRPYPPALLLLALLGAGWLAARMGDVQVVMQYSFVAMFPVAAVALFGPRLAGSLAFPLLFLLFAVPFGEIFVEPLIQFTADFTIWAVQATGIPVLRNGTRFELPTGSWSVVEACSGIRYLISSITLGCLYAYLTYHSTLRRVVFIGLSILVPIVANGLRAYMIVMIGHSSGMELATGVDHIIYGWLFFGLIMFIMFWVGSYWREDEQAAAQRAAAHTMVPSLPGRIVPVAAGAVLVAALWPAFAVFNDRANHNPAPVQLAEPSLAWQVAAGFPDWRVDYMEPDARLERTYTRTGVDRPVRLQVLYYRNQTKQKGLISSVNRLTGEKDPYHPLSSAGRSEQVDGRSLALRETVLNSAGGKLLVWQVLWIGGQYTPSNVVGKLRQAESRLRFRGDDGAMIALAAPFTESQDKARGALRAFLGDNFKALDAALAATQGR
ncbi:exosortase A [Massilia sp. ST3]|uniref:exosortase A n=1 Tax=Massilia sp. ST3 TaxID=2824903 RepID=UPI001B8264F2|nr:exosortase A [Massilia sp. ST3]MBQ5948149.1 exosortase A [Massilia sp. ST3]